MRGFVRAQRTDRVDAWRPDRITAVRWLRFVVGAYVLTAVLTRLVEAAGLRRCECRADCWCKRPVLSTFRWVFPRWHR